MKARSEAPASGAAPSGAEFGGGLAAEGRSQTDRSDKNGNAGGFDKAFRGLKDAGLLARLEENVSGADAWVYSALITKIKAA